jgi:hypothetical protein
MVSSVPARVGASEVAITHTAPTIIGRDLLADADQHNAFLALAHLPLRLHTDARNTPGVRRLIARPKMMAI